MRTSFRLIVTSLFWNILTTNYYIILNTHGLDRCWWRISDFMLGTTVRFRCHIWQFVRWKSGFPTIKRMTKLKYHHQYIKNVTKISQASYECFWWRRQVGKNCLLGTHLLKLNRTLKFLDLKSRTELQLEYFYFIIQLDCVKYEFY